LADLEITVEYLVGMDMLESQAQLNKYIHHLLFVVAL